VFNERRGRRQAAGKARKAPPPWLVWAICEAACNPPPGSTEVQIEKFRELYVDMLGASRGGGFHGSSVIPPMSTKVIHHTEKEGNFLFHSSGRRMVSTQCVSTFFRE